MRDFEHSLPMQLLKARELAMAKFRPMLRDHQVTEQQWRVLRALAGAQRHPIDATTLAQMTMLLAPSLSRILQHLQQVGWVDRVSDEQDQRRSYLTLTKLGRAKFDDVTPHAEREYAAIENAFGSDKLEALYELLDEFGEAMQSQQPSPPSD